MVQLLPALALAARQRLDGRALLWKSFNPRWIMEERPMANKATAQQYDTTLTPQASHITPQSSQPILNETKRNETRQNMVLNHNWKHHQVKTSLALIVTPSSRRKRAAATKNHPPQQQQSTALWSSAAAPGRDDDDPTNTSVFPPLSPSPAATTRRFSVTFPADFGTTAAVAGALFDCFYEPRSH